MLTECDRKGLPYLIVGTRLDGSQLVLGEARTFENADGLANSFRDGLEGYVQVEVELVGK